jgi:hypothetical protein
MIADGHGVVPYLRNIVADDAGALLVRSGLVSSAALDEARAKQADHGGTIGEQLVAAGLADDDKLTSFYRQRLLVPQVNPNTLARLPAKVVAVIPSEMAIELRAIPVSLDSDNNLTVAMSDPSDRHAVDEIAFFTGTYVVRAVATQMQIAWCLAHYYGHITELGERLLQSEKEASNDDAPRPRTRGITDEIKAQRHRGLVPGDAFIAPTPDPDAPKPRSKTASGEIRVPRAPSIKPPLPDDSGPVVVVEDSDSGPIEPPRPTPPAKRDSDPVIEMEAEVGGPHEPVLAIAEGNESKPVPKRRRPAEPDPPELAARAGEVQLATGQPIKKIEFDAASIIISDDLAEEISPREDHPTQPVPIVHAIEVSGEVPGREHRDEAPNPEELSSIFVELGDLSAPILIHDRKVDESGPVMLDRRRDGSDAPTSVTLTAAPAREIDDEPSVPIELPVKRAPEQRLKKTTQVGIGAISASTRTKLAVPSEIEDAPTNARRMLDNDPTRIDAHAVAPGDDDVSDEVLAAPPSPYDHRDTTPHAAPPRPTRPTGESPPPSGQIKLDNVKPAARPADEGDDDDDATGNTTAVMSPIELDESIPGHTANVLPAHLDADEQTGKKPRAPSPPAGEDVDDGWGPPGTTIPPPLLGAIPGSITPASGIIPIPNIDSAPLIVAPPLPPEPSRGARQPTVTEQHLARALEEATANVLELIHTLDHTTERDQIIAVMIAHLAETHRRAGFFAMRAGALSLFAITPRIPQMPTAELRLDRPSTLQDIVGTRLPYRGPMVDDTSRGFLAATLGASPPEILLVPIAVRERVVGVLFGDQRVKHTFDDQLALAARAAGMALERLLKAKRH